MTLAWLPALVVPPVLGFFVVSALGNGSRWYRIFLGVGSGLALTSCTAYIDLADGGITGSTFIWLESAALIGAAAWWFVARRQERPTPPIPPWRTQDYILGAVFVLVVLMAVYVFVRLSITYPHGEWDAWNNWNHRARYILRAGEHWNYGATHLETLRFHPFDYPMMLSLSVARMWSWLGRETVLAPIFIAPLFTLAAVGVLFTALKDLTDRSQAFIAAGLLVGTRYYINIATAQYSDIALGFMYTAVLIQLVRFDRAALDRRKPAALAGLMCGLAIWTKNEGLVFLVCLIAARVLVRLFRMEWRELIKEAGWFLVGLAPAAAVTIHFKLVFATGSHHFQEPLGLILTKFLDLARHKEVALYMLSEMGPLWAMAIYLVLLRPRPGALKERGVTTGLLAVLGTLIAYYLQFVMLAPQTVSLHWYLAVNSNRLIIQLWPAGLFVFFMIVRAPEFGPLYRAGFGASAPTREETYAD